MNIEKQTINFKDNQQSNLVDSFSENQKSNLRPRGEVKIFEKRIEGTEKKLYLVGQSSNLIVYHGRNWLMQRAFGQDYNTGAFSGWSDLKIGWFAIGTGAAPSDPMTPTAPTLGDIALATHGTITNGTSFVTVSAKEYHTFDSITYEVDSDATGYVGYDNYLKAKIQTTLTSTEANSDGGASGYSGYTYYQDINEAGLYFSNVSTVSPPPTTVEMFARVTFATIRKTNTRELVFNWYIFF